ncbi:helix-turn-helix domain-containing protein [Nitrosococcus oceani]|nr:helix-turn-helix domain-containing protein [Nitrosococcus oceani]
MKFGHARWVWNKYLHWRTHTYREEGGKVSS